jgi:hypothetical protein
MIRQTDITTPAADSGRTDCRDTSLGRFVLTGMLVYGGAVAAIVVIVAEVIR